MAEEAVKAGPMPLADIVTCVDEFRDVAMPDGKDPTGHEGTKQREAGFAEVALEADEQNLKVPGKISHRRPSLVWELVWKPSQIAKKADVQTSPKTAKLELTYVSFFE